MASNTADMTPALSSPQKSTTNTNEPRRQPSLLPAFEPLSSSPGGLPRATKRKFDDIVDERKYYPTPVPTSSTGILPSSPPGSHARRTRPGLQRTISTLSERAPLGDVPTLDLPFNGEPVLMGRSSNSSDYQLSANRHISRVHVRASFHAADVDNATSRVEVECLGWNGAKVHCKGEIVELQKGEVFVSDKPMAQIMVDVQDTRVMLVWPREQDREVAAVLEEPSREGSRSPWAGAEESPSKVMRRSASRGQEAFASSPPPMLPPRPRSPVSPTLGNAGVENSMLLTTFHGDQPNDGSVQVYEDHASDEDAPHDATPTPEIPAAASPKENVAATHEKLNQSQGSEQEEFSEHDEENDPVVHSFGPFGENILSRFESFQPKSPERVRKPLQASSNSPAKRTSESSPAPPAATVENASPIRNHVINQLAFSRIHSLPLSIIHSNLPVELRGAAKHTSPTHSPLSPNTLKSIMDAIPCVGEISREGKDAAGKLLESEFYYVPEMDEDEMRRETVMQSLGKTSIRAARKCHKQYYWKKPRN
ncbi:hypothetical protein KC367_g7299 [Hortaea werneckii]|nr:hypothetical protein KC367_g7299 [Hortaea werneckii]